MTEIKARIDVPITFDPSAKDTLCRGNYTLRILRPDSVPPEAIWSDSGHWTWNKDGQTWAVSPIFVWGEA